MGKLTEDYIPKFSLGILIAIGSGLIALTGFFVSLSTTGADNAKDVAALKEQALGDAQFKADMRRDIAVIKTKVEYIEKSIKNQN